jgi:hypothetical protein
MFVLQLKDERNAKNIKPAPTAEMLQKENRHWMRFFALERCIYNLVIFY